MQPGRRRPRFERVPTRNFHLTDRDLQIIEYVERHRLLNSKQIVALLGEGSPQHVRRRLQLLFHNRYLDRPAVQIADFYRTPGTLPMVYGLGNKGADALADHLGRPRTTGDWASKNRSIRSTFFHHTLMVSSIMVAFEISDPINVLLHLEMTSFNQIDVVSPVSNGAMCSLMSMRTSR